MKKMEDAIQRQHGEERIGWIVDDGGGEQTVCYGDKHQQAVVGFFRRNEAKFKDSALRAGDVDGRIGVVVDVVEVFGKGILEKLLLERGEVEVGVGEEEEAILSLGFLEKRWENVLEWLERKTARLKKERSSSLLGRGIGTKE